MNPDFLIDSKSNVFVVAPDSIIEYKPFYTIISTPIPQSNLAKPIWTKTGPRHHLVKMRSRHIGTVQLIPCSICK